MLAALERPRGLHGLDGVRAVLLRRAAGANRALAGMRVLRGDDDREGDEIILRLGLGVIVGTCLKVARVPAAVLLFHLSGGLGHGLSGKHAAPEGLLVFIVATKGDRFRVAADGLHALCAQRCAKTLRGHTEADGHPKHAVRRVLGHMVGDDGAVNAPGAVAIIGMVVGLAVTGGDARLVGGGQAGAGRQREVGGIRLGNAVINVYRPRIRVIGIFGICIAQHLVIVRHAMGVEDHDRAVFHGLGHAANGRLGAGIDGAGAAGGLGNVLALVLILLGKGVVRAVPRADDVDVLAGGRAAAGGVGRGLDFTDRRGVNAGRAVFHARAEGRRIALRLAVGILPEEHSVCPVIGTGALGVILRGHDELGNIAGERRIIGSSQLVAEAAGFAQVLGLIGEDLRPEVFLLRRPGKAGQQRQKHGEGKQQG